MEIPREDLLSHMIILPNNTGISLIKNSLFADLSKPPITKPLAELKQYPRSKLKNLQYFKNHTKINSITLITMHFALSSAL